jgi:hypothetical protein
MIFGFWVLSVLGSSLFPCLFAAEGTPLNLSVGEQHLVYIVGLKRYSLSGDAAKAISLPLNLASSSQNAQESILIKGIHPGLSDLWVWKSDGSSLHRTIQVEAYNVKKKISPLERALQKLNETEMIASSEVGIVLRGEIKSFEEAAKISALQRTYPKEILNETTLSFALLQQGKLKLKQWIKKNFKEEKLSVLDENGALFVQGSVRSPTEQEEVEREIRSIFPAVIFELDTLPDQAPTVYFRVFLLEIKHNYFRSFGLNWPPEQLNAFQVARWGVQESVGLDVALQALETEGAVRVLSRPELVVRAPGEAELFSGGELPIRTKTNFSSHVSWKPYGLLLRLKITHLAGENIRLEIQTEVSQLDLTAGNDDIPGLKANRMKTQVDALMGKPLLLSGLLQEESREQAKGLPWISKIPILGLLFGSEEYLKARSELVAILLPLKSPPRPVPPESTLLHQESQSTLPPLRPKPRLHLPFSLRGDS